MTKATHNGTCQVCGRRQAHRYGYGIAKHGYTVKQGWWQGICRGSEKPPLELSSILCDEIIANLREQGPHLVATKPEDIRHVLIDWKDGDAWTPRKTKVVTSAEDLAAFLATDDGKRYGRFGARFTTWAELQRNEASRLRHQGEMMLAHAQSMEELKALVHGTPLKERRI